ncbi:hypothetical protein [Jejuia spongiicola]|uniref:Uncharacterized protein n=1 Tax=Jejuia spongiicola TaxID=2942207 RepID=A0ABT0QBS9_9FLAO|nr:hypothetical protein [Jejuia spongiicola]MCL6293719.1 hypothetical protein [Jejuia spongiicola]
MGRNKIVLLSIVILLGFLFPFISYFVIIEMFFLLIPLGVLFVISAIYLVISLLKKSFNNKKAFFVFSIIPIFILSQIISVFTVDKIQKLRSERIISEIEKTKSQTGYFPEEFDISMGIEYNLIEEGESYTLEHSRGFFEIERYYSDSKNWQSFGFDH